MNNTIKYTIILSSYHPIILSSYHPIILSSYHPIILSSYHPIILSSTMALKCTKRIIDYSIRERLFCIFDRSLPYEIHITYKRAFPHVSGGSGMGVNIGHANITDVQNIEFVTETTKRISNPDEFVRELEQGKCIECGNIAHCTARKYKFKFD